MRILYTLGFKLNVITRKSMVNSAAERHFGPPPVKKMISEWRRHEE